MSCALVAKVLYLDDDTIRTWHRLHQEDGIKGLASFGYEGSACRLTAEQRERVTACITEALPRTSREIGAWIARECGPEYEGRSGLIALLHRLGMDIAGRRRSRARWTRRSRQCSSGAMKHC
jgi:transposase